MTKNKKVNVNSITTNSELISQQTLNIQKHDVQKKYIVLADNKMALTPGYFNRKTNFLVGEKRSFMGYDKNFNELDNTSTSELFKQDGYFIYPIPCFMMKNNESVDFKNEDVSYQVHLNDTLGYKIGRVLAGEKTTDPFIDMVIDRHKGIGLNKNFLLNSNSIFAVNILLGYYNKNKEHGFFINSFTNLYSITNIFHYLGASYSIANVENNRKRVYFKLPYIFKESFSPKFIRKRQYFKNKSLLAEKINNGLVLAVPFNSCTLEEVESEETLYDLTCERYDATNYSIPMSPILKNSDGDILAASGVFTKEGLQDAKKFSPSNKEYYKSLNDGTIEQWISDDAILGLYNATNLKNKNKQK